MPNRKVPAALGAALILCAVGVYEWKEQTAKTTPPSPQPAGSAAPSAAAPSSQVAASPTPSPAEKPVVYVVGTAAPTPAPESTSAGNGAGSGEVTVPPATPLPASQSAIPAAQQRRAEYRLPPPPVLTSANAPPEIVALSISSPVVHSGELISGSVETSTNVASVEARIGGYSSNLRKTAAGRFEISYRVPFVPFFLKKTYTVQIIARNTRGAAAATSFPITVR